MQIIEFCQISFEFFWGGISIYASTCPTHFNFVRDSYLCSVMVKMLGTRGPSDL